MYGWYEDFIPIYIFSTLRVFPQHYVKVFLKGSLSENTKIALSLIRNKISDSFEVVENFKDFDHCEIIHPAAYRFLLTREYFQGFDYVYFGDVDFVICNMNNDNFYESYLAHCKKTGLPFSNAWNYDWGRYRMTGLHFVIKDAYFDIMDPFIEEMKGPNVFKERYRSRDQTLIFDEEMLFYMAFKAFDLRPLIDYIRPLPGLHFGIFRKTDPSCSFVRTYYKQFNELKENTKLNEILTSEMFSELQKLVGPQVKANIDNVMINFYKKLFI